MQSSRHILLIRPARFGFNTQTAASNSFQQNVAGEANEISQNALAEFNNFATLLQTHGVNALIIDDTAEPLKPDAIFPNNWLSMHSDGKVVLYPMCTPNRRAERRPDIIEKLREQFVISNIINLSDYENEGKFLEGTGSIVFDHENKIAYASLSVRTDRSVFIGLCELLSYRPIYFHAHDAQGHEIYHSNVMMCLGKDFVVICSASIANEDDRQLVLNTLRETGHEVIEIKFEQLNNFAGNMLSVLNRKNEQLLILSQTAFNSLSLAQKSTLGKYARLLPISIPTIETIGGGSARCMMAEIFLPER